MEKSQSLETPPLFKRRPKIKELTIDDDKVYIRQWSIRTKLSFATPEQDQTLFVGKLLMNSVCDENGVLLFTENDLSDLLDTDATFAETLAKEILAFNGFDLDAKKN